MLFMCNRLDTIKISHCTSRNAFFFIRKKKRGSGEGSRRGEEEGKLLPILGLCAGSYSVKYDDTSLRGRTHNGSGVDLFVSSAASIQGYL